MRLQQLWFAAFDPYLITTYLWVLGVLVVVVLVVVFIVGILLTIGWFQLFGLVFACRNKQCNLVAQIRTEREPKHFSISN